MSGRGTVRLGRGGHGRKDEIALAIAGGQLETALDVAPDTIPQIAEGQRNALAPQFALEIDEQFARHQVDVVDRSAIDDDPPHRMRRRRDAGFDTIAEELAVGKEERR